MNLSFWYYDSMLEMQEAENLGFETVEEYYNFLDEQRKKNRKIKEQEATYARI